MPSLPPERKVISRYRLKLLNIFIPFEASLCPKHIFQYLNFIQPIFFLFSLSVFEMILEVRFDLFLIPQLVDSLGVDYATNFLGDILVLQTAILTVEVPQTHKKSK